MLLLKNKHYLCFITIILLFTMYLEKCCTHILTSVLMYNIIIIYITSGMVKNNTL